MIAKIGLPEILVLLGLLFALLLPAAIVVGVYFIVKGSRARKPSEELRVGRFCNRCGSPIVLSAAFCSKCGAKQEG